MRSLPTRTVLIVGAVIVLLCSVIAALTVGSVSVPAGTAIDVVTRRLGLTSPQVTLLDDQIVWQLRMPRVLGAAAVGAALALCGAVLQSFTGNDLADPYLLGIASGAQVGAVSVIVMGAGAGLLGAAAMTVASFIGALAALVLVLLLAADRFGGMQPTRVVLAGVVVSYLGAAYSSVVVLMRGHTDAAREVLSWTLGSMAGLRWESALFLMMVAGVALVISMALSDLLDAFAFGADSAASLGVNVNRARWGLMVWSALITAGVVAFVGAIGFVGLVIPHLARMVVGPGHRMLLPVCALLGALLMVWADTLARSLVDGSEVPIGAITALLGAPFFAWLMRKVVRA